LSAKALARRKARHAKVESSTNPRGQITLAARAARTPRPVELSTPDVIKNGDIRAPKSSSTLYNQSTDCMDCEDSGHSSRRRWLFPFCPGLPAFGAIAPRPETEFQIATLAIPIPWTP